MKMQGASVVESLVVVAIVGITLALAQPSMSGLPESRRVEGTAGELSADIQFARSEAVARNGALRLRFQSDAGGTCYLLHTGAANACTCNSSGTSVCTLAADTVIKSAVQPAERGVAVESNVTSMVFHASRGTVTPSARVDVTGTSGKDLRLVVNILGRARVCSPGASMPGYDEC